MTSSPTSRTNSSTCTTGSRGITSARQIPKGSRIASRERGYPRAMPGVPASGHDLLRQTSYQDALRDFRWSALWDLVDGDRTRLNLGHECVDRHPANTTALRIQFADGRR